MTSAHVTALLAMAGLVLASCSANTHQETKDIFSQGHQASAADETTPTEDVKLAEVDVYIHEHEGFTHTHKLGGVPHSHQGAKMLGAIDISSNYNGKSTLTEVENIELTFTDGYDNGTLEVTLIPTGDMTLFSPTETRFSMSGDGVHTMSVSLALNSEGDHYLNVNTVAALDDGNAFQANRHIHFPVGDEDTLEAMRKAAQQKAEAQDNSDGIIDMSAEETIIRPE